MNFKANDYTSANQSIYKYHYGDTNFLLSIQTLSGKVYNEAYVHSHEEYQFMAPMVDFPGIVRGEEEICAKAGRVYFFNSFCPHGIARDVVGMAYTRLIIKKDFFEKVTASIPGFSLKNLPRFGDTKSTEEVKFYVSMYKKECRRDDKRSPLILEGLATTIVIELIRGLVDPNKEMQNKLNTYIKIEDICRYITENSSKDLTVGEIAAKFAISKYHFIRSFSKAKGQTPMAFLAMARIARARNLLEYQTYSISEISNICGFSSLDYFSKAFKKNVGTSPSKYREVCKNNRINGK